MRLAPRTRERACHACAVVGPGEARFCGACGTWLEGVSADTPLGVPSRPSLRARLAGEVTPSMVPVRPPDPDVQIRGGASDGIQTDVPAVPAADRGRRARLVGALALVAVITASALTGSPDADIGPSLAGRLDVNTGMSSAFAPSTQLRLLWRRGLEERADPGPPVAPVLLDDAHMKVGDAVIALSTGRVLSVGVPTPGPDGVAVVADGRSLLRVDPVRGSILDRSEITGEPDWSPSGAVLGWLGGDVVLAGEDGRAAAVAGSGPDAGAVRWVLPHGTTWLAAGTDGSGFLATVTEQSATMLVAHDAADASPSVLALQQWSSPVLVGEMIVDATMTTDGVVVTGTSHVTGDGWGLVSPAMVAGPTAQAKVVAVQTQLEDEAGPIPAVAVIARAPGSSTSTVWIDARDGTVLGVATAGGTGRDDYGWPVAGVAGEAMVHVDPVREEIRAVDLFGVVRWSIPSDVDHGVAVGATHALLWTSPRRPQVQGRFRLVEVATGDVVWDRVDGSGLSMRIAGVVAERVVVRGPEEGQDILGWSYELDEGRRRPLVDAIATEARLATAPLRDAAERTQLLGSVADGVGSGPLLLQESERGQAAGTAIIGLGDVERPGPAGFLAARSVLAGEVLVMSGNADALWWSEPGGALGQRDDATLLGAAGARVLVRELAGTHAGRLMGWDPTGGLDEWAGPMVAPGVTVRADADVIVAVTAGAVTLVDPATGAVRWAAEASGLLRPDAAVLHADRVVILGVDGRAVAYDLASGDRRWETPAELGIGLVLTGAGDVTIVGTDDGRMVLLDAAGAAVDEVETGRDRIEDVAVADGQLIATTGSSLVSFGRGAWFIEQEDSVRLP